MPPVPCPPTVQAMLASFGYIDNPGAEYLLNFYGPSGSNLFTVLMQRNAPSNQAGCSWCYNEWIGHLVARGILYTSSVSGNGCAKGNNLPSASAGAAGVSSAGALVRAGISSVSAISSIGGQASLGFAAAGSAVGDALGFATLGIGLAIGPLIALIQHHGQAVQAEDNTICSVATAANQTIPAIDQAVASGSVTAAQGIQAMNTLVTQLKVSLNSILKGCNAACCYQALLDMHLDFANTFYVDLSPMKTLPPVSPGSYAPAAASAPTVAAIADTISPPPGSPQIVNSTAQQNSANLNAAASQGGTFSSIPNIVSAGTGTTPATSTTDSSWILIILFIVGFLVFSMM